MPILAALAQVPIVRLAYSLYEEGTIQLDPSPLFDPVSDSVRIRVIQNRSAKTIAILAPLVVYPSVVLCSRVHSYRYWDLLVRPSARNTCIVVAYESTHDMCVVFMRVVPRIVRSVEAEGEIVIPE